MFDFILNEDHTSHDENETNCLRKKITKIQHDKTCDDRVHYPIKSTIHASNGWCSEKISEALLYVYADKEKLIQC
jgi:hypothetical protein